MMSGTLLRFVLSALVLLGAVPAGAQSTLEARLRPLLSDRNLAGAKVALRVVQLGDRAGADRVLYSTLGDQALMPASNMKLLTVAAALHTLKPDFAFSTGLMLHEGDLHLWGDGDPTLGDAELLRPAGWTTTTVFRHWADELRRRGIRQVRHVIFDDSVFDEEFIHPRWPAGQLNRRYAAEVAGLNLNANCIDLYLAPADGNATSCRLDPVTRYVTIRNLVRPGAQNTAWGARAPQSNEITLRGDLRAALVKPLSVTVYDPAAFTATVMAETLREAGVEITGEVRRDRQSRQRYQAARPADRAPWTAIGVHKTPLPIVLTRCNKDSMNLYAEALLKRIGFAAAGQSGSWANGGAAVLSYARSLGVNIDNLKIDDGSGLSRDNRVTAELLCAVLSSAHHGPGRDAFAATLAVAGVDGTLDDRFSTFPHLQKRVLAKSGYISGVRSLSGYLNARDGRVIAFAILMNDVVDGRGAEVKLLQERMVAAIEGGN